MTEFSRLVDDEGADPELARIFRAGRAPTPLSHVTFERSRKRVLGLVAAPVAIGVLTLMQHAALGAALGTTAALVVAMPRLLADPPLTPRALPASSATSTLTSADAPERAPLPLPTEPPAPAASVDVELHAAAPASAAEHPLLRETKLLEQARAELDRRPARCLELLAEHSREFPNGALGLERDFLAVASLIKLDRRPEAEARAASLRARAPGSLYEERLERILSGGVPR
jgi:hypothetical protein